MCYFIRPTIKIIKLRILVEARQEGKGGKPKGDELSPGSSSQSNCDGGDVPAKGVVGPSKGVAGPVKGVNEGGNSCLEKVKNAVKEDNLSTTSTFIHEEKETFIKRQIGGGYGLSREPPLLGGTQPNKRLPQSHVSSSVPLGIQRIK